MSPGPTILTAQLTGTPLPESWAQTISFGADYADEVPPDHVYAVIHVARSDSEDSTFFGRACLQQLEKFNNTAKEPAFERLKKMLAKADELAAKEGGGLAQLSLVIAIVTDNKLYVGGIGQSNALLVRDAHIYSLEFSKVKDRIISGVCKPGDYILLGTAGFFEHAYPTSQLFDGKNTPQDITDTLSPLLLSLSQNAEIAAIILWVKESALSIVGDEPKPMLKDQSVAMEAPAKEVPVTQEASGQSDHPLLEVESQAKSGIFSGAYQLSQKVRPYLYALQKKQRTDTTGSEQRMSMVDILHQPTKAIHTRNKLALVFMAGCILLTLFLMALLVVRVWHNHERSQAIQLYAAAATDVAQAQSLKTQNPKQATQLLLQAKQLVAKAQRTDAHVQMPSGLLDSIDQTMQAVNATVAVQTPKVVFNLGLIKQGFSASHLDLAGTSLIAIDNQAPTILRLSTDTKNATIATGGSKIPNFITAALNGDTILALTQDGIFAIDDSTGQAKQVIAKDSNWGTITSIAAYLGNIYLLDSAKSQLWKYAASGNSFSTIKNIITASGQDFSQAQDLVVDGSLWFVKDNQIIRVTNGNIASYTTTNLDHPLGSFLRIATASQNGNLYILDRENKRIVVASKDGTYVNQYQSSSFNEVIDLAVDEAGKTIYLLTKDKVEQIPITQ